MDESAARIVLAIRAIELEDRERTLWSDTDRAWASESAARELGAGRPRWPRRRGSAPLPHALATFATEWSHLATPLYVARAARLLHAAAALFAAGIVAGLYLHGIAVEYRASWESTFLDA